MEPHSGIPVTAKIMDVSTAKQVAFVPIYNNHSLGLVMRCPMFTLVHFNGQAVLSPETTEDFQVSCR